LPDNIQDNSPERRRAFETFETTVQKVDDLTPRNKGIHFHLEGDHQLHYKPGQFMQVFVPVEGDKPRRTSYSIASVPRHTDRFELCVTLVEGGKSSSYLHSLKVGDKVTAMGPLGRFTMPEPLPRDTVFIATGSGIAPFRSMIGYLFDHGVRRNVYLVFGNRFDTDIIYKSEWEELARKFPNFKPQLSLSRPTDAWKGPKGYVQDQIEGFIPNPKEKDFYICGLTAMINGVQDKLLSLGVPKEQIHYERYD
jgi:ferredoxin-NADP reductase